MKIGCVIALDERRREINVLLTPEVTFSKSLRGMTNGAVETASARDSRYTTLIRARAHAISARDRSPPAG